MFIVLQSRFVYSSLPLTHLLVHSFLVLAQAILSFNTLVEWHKKTLQKSPPIQSEVYYIPNMAIQHIGAGTEEASTPDSSGCGSGPNASKPLLNGHRNGIEHVEHAVSNLSTPSPTSDHSTTGHKTPESHKSNESGYRPRYPRRADRIDQAITAKNAQCFFDHTCSIFVGK